MQAERDDMLDSIQTGDVPAVKSYLDAGTPVNFTDEEGWSLLHHAAACGQVEVIQLLQENGCYIDSVDNNGRTALHYATGNGSVECVRILIEMGSHVNALDNEHTTPLQWAVMCEQYSVMELLVEHGGTVEVDDTVASSTSVGVSSKGVNSSEQIGLKASNSPGSEISKMENNFGENIFKAAQSGDIASVKAYLDLGVPVDLTDEDGWSPIHHAIAHGQVEVIRLLMDRGCRMVPVKSRILPSLDHAGVHNSRKCDIFDAARSGDTAKLKECVELGVSVDVTDEDGRTPLHCAAGEGQVDTVKLLINKGCCIDPEDHNGLTPSMYATMQGKDEVELLLNLAESVLNSTGRTPLHAAAADGQLEVIEMLLSVGGRKLMTMVAGKAGSPLHQAAAGGHKDVVTLLLNEGCPIDIKASNGFTALHCAAQYGQIVIIEMLVNHGLDVNVVINKGKTPLHVAAAFGKLESVRTLLRLGGRNSLTKIAGDEGTPLHHAVAGGHKDLVTLLLKEGCSVTTRTSKGASVLHFAAQFGQEELIAYLIDCGLDANIEDDDGATPLHWAACHGQFESICVLLRLGGRRSMAMIAGGVGTPLHVAVLQENKDIVSLLLSVGCPMNLTTTDGLTALHIAAVTGQVDIIEMLVGHGLDVNIQDDRGFTPLHSAACNNQLESARTLIGLGGRRSITGDGLGAPLHVAAEKGHKEMVSLLLKEGCPTNVTDANGKSAVHFAAMSGEVDIVKMLVKQGLDVRLRDGDGSTALHLAAQCGHVVIIEMLVYYGLDVNVEDNEGRTPLHSAALHGQFESVRALLRLGGRKSLTKSGREGGTPLHQAVAGGHKDMVTLLLKEGCPITTRANNGVSVLHFAAHFGQVELITYLIDCGLDANIEDDDGATPLHWAAYHGRLESVCALLRLGGRRSITMIAGDGGTPLHVAVRRGNKDIVSLLLSEGCPMNLTINGDLTALHIAAATGQVDIIEKFVSHGLEVNIEDDRGRTPLHSAACENQLESARTLIGLGGGRIMTVTADGLGTPLHQAAAEGHKDMVSLLLKKGCPSNVTDDNGISAAHIATMFGKVDIIEMLVNHGLDVNVVNDEGITPLHTAASHGHLESVCALLRSGGKASMTMVAGHNGTPLHQAVQRGDNEIVSLLLDEGCPINMATSGGLNALHAAANYDRMDLVDLLVERGCDVNAVDEWGATPMFYGISHIELMQRLLLSGGKISHLDNFGMNSLEHFIAYKSVSSQRLKSYVEASGIVCDGSNFVNVISTLSKNNLIDINRVLCLAAVSGHADLFDEIVDSDLPLDQQRMRKLVQAVRIRTKPQEVIENWLNELHILDDPLNPLHLSLIFCKQLGPGAQSTAQHKYAERVISHPRTKYTIYELFPNGLSPLDIARQFDLHDIAGMIERAGGRPGMWADLPKEMAQKRMEILRSLKKVRGSEFGEDYIRTLLIMCGCLIKEEEGSKAAQNVVLAQTPEQSDVEECVRSNVKELSKWRRVGELLKVNAPVLDKLAKDADGSDDAYCSMLKYWLKHGHSVTWKTLLDAIGHFETKKTMDDIREKMERGLSVTNVGIDMSVFASHCNLVTVTTFLSSPFTRYPHQIQCCLHSVMVSAEIAC